MQLKFPRVRSSPARTVASWFTSPVFPSCQGLHVDATATPGRQSPAWERLASGSSGDNIRRNNELLWGGESFVIKRHMGLSEWQMDPKTPSPLHHPTDLHSAPFSRSLCPFDTDLWWQEGAEEKQKIIHWEKKTRHVVIRMWLGIGFMTLKGCRPIYLPTC